MAPPSALPVTRLGELLHPISLLLPQIILALMLSGKLQEMYIVIINVIV